MDFTPIFRFPRDSSTAAYSKVVSDVRRRPAKASDPLTSMVMPKDGLDRTGLMNRQGSALDRLRRAASDGVSLQASPRGKKVDLQKHEHSLVTMSSLFDEWTSKGRRDLSSLFADVSSLQAAREPQQSEENGQIICLANALALLSSIPGHSGLLDASRRAVKEATKLSLTHFHLKEVVTNLRSCTKSPVASSLPLQQRLIKQVENHLQRIETQGFDKHFQALTTALVDELTRLAGANFINGINFPRDLAILFDGFLIPVILSHHVNIWEKHKLTLSLPLRLVFAISRGSESPTPWQYWGADTDKEAKMFGETAVTIAFKTSLEPEKNSLNVAQLSSWKFREFAMGEESRAIFASFIPKKEVGAPSDLRKQHHALLFIDETHVKAKKGSIVQQYKTIIISQLTKIIEANKLQK